MDEWFRDHADLRRRKFVVGSLGSGPMHRLSYLRGFEGFMMDIVENQKQVAALLDGVFAFLKGVTEEYARRGLDGIILVDDQAGQRWPFFSMGV